MTITSYNQYNQSIGKSKVFSSVAGVGSIITTKLGYYILISDFNKWKFVKRAHKLIQEVITDENNDSSKIYNSAKVRLLNRGIPFIDDQRFVEFIRKEKKLDDLICIIGIPSISLNEQTNIPNWENHPITKALKEFEEIGKAEDYMVLGTHFPKWFINDKGLLKTYSKWKELWNQNHPKKDSELYFCPPRDITTPQISKSNYAKNNSEPFYKPLTQTNLILICPNGHLSDIPWPKFLRWKSDGKNKSNGENLFVMPDCCSNVNLKWTENKTKSEGYGSIFIECLSCKRKENLEGINSLKPICSGEKPWEIPLDTDEFNTKPDECKNERRGEAGRMQVTLVTSNNVYYANNFSSIYIPQYLAQNKSTEMLIAEKKCLEKFNRNLKVNVDLTKERFWEDLNKEDFIIDCELRLSDVREFLLLLKDNFLGNPEEENIDRYEAYRQQEYTCFVNHASKDEQGLIFSDISMPNELEAFFIKIQQVEELKVTQIQLDFTRVEQKVRVRIGNEIVQSTSGKNIFSLDKESLLTLPAIEMYGEGLFFQFNNREINNWINRVQSHLQKRFSRFMTEQDWGSQGGTIKQRIKNNGYKHFLIHTFSHILMRELEFTCGYPTSSLKERLYISEDMSGVMLYTSEGAEGSMGGIVWQGQPDKIKELILKGLYRSVNCSSDPLCWESEGQGIYDLNLAACFSCSLVSETACEEMNLGLDRSILIDEEFGFFKNLLK